MTPRRPRLAAALTLAALALAPGCGASREELHQGLDDDVRFASRVMGFALDAHVETLRTQLGLLQAFEGDPRLGELEKRIGTAAEVQAKIERVRADRQSLIEEAQRLRRRFGAAALPDAE